MRVVNSFECELTVDEKDIVYLPSITELVVDKLPGAISATFSGAFKSMVSTGGYNMGVSDTFITKLNHARITRYVDILATRYKIPDYIRDQIEAGYGTVGSNLLRVFYDLSIENLDSMHLTPSVKSHSVSIFKNTATINAVYQITGNILKPPYISENKGYPFKTIKRIYQ